jgi:hypothetical protein
LWNPRTRELLNVEEDDAGRLAGFRARFGGMFDTAKGIVEDTEPEAKTAKQKAAAVSTEKIGADGQEEVQTQGDGRKERREMKVEDAKKEKQKLTQQQPVEEEDEGWDFGEEDENMLDLISRFGQNENLKVKDSQIVSKKR